MPESPEAQEWHRVIRASVRECLETWQLQSKDGPATVEFITVPDTAGMWWLVPILGEAW